MCILLNFHPMSCVNLAPNKYKQERIISIHPLFIKMHSSLRANHVKESRPWSTNRHNMLSHPNSGISCWQKFFTIIENNLQSPFGYKAPAVCTHVDHLQNVHESQQRVSAWDSCEVQFPFLSEKHNFDFRKFSL